MYDGINEHSVRYKDGSVIYFEENIDSLQAIIDSDDPKYDQIIPCFVNSINKDISGMTSPSGLPVFLWNDRLLVQGETYEFSMREIAKIIYSCSSACDFCFNPDLDVDDVYGPSLFMNQNITAALARQKVKRTQHGSISEYPVHRATISDDKEYEYYNKVKRNLKGKGFVQCPIGIVPRSYCEELNFLKK